MNYYMDNISTEQLIHILLHKLNEIDTRLCNIETVIGHVQTSSNKMDNHISFVETVYNIIKFPLSFIINQIPPVNKYNTLEILPTRNIHVITDSISQLSKDK